MAFKDLFNMNPMTQEPVQEHRQEQTQLHQRINNSQARNSVYRNQLGSSIMAAEQMGGYSPQKGRTSILNAQLELTRVKDKSPN